MVCPFSIVELGSNVDKVYAIVATLNLRTDWRVAGDKASSLEAKAARASLEQVEKLDLDVGVSIA